MRITIFGATGNVGSRTVKEALSRGHEVTAVIRDKASQRKIPAEAKAVIGRADNAEDVIRFSQGQDLVISAVRPPTGMEPHLITMTKAILDGTTQIGVRALIVGGAASLKMPDDNNLTVLTAPDFLPEDVVPIARACFTQYKICMADRQADWSYISPPAMLTPGTRTGQYRLGDDELLIDENGNSAISMEDFAVALIDEAETPQHKKTRFTVAY